MGVGHRFRVGVRIRFREKYCNQWPTPHFPLFGEKPSIIKSSQITNRVAEAEPSIREELDAYLVLVFLD